MFYEKSIQNDSFDIIKYPLFTTKAIGLMKKDQYIFAVDATVDKSSIKAAIEQLFGVKVVSVNTSVLSVRKNRSGTYKRQKDSYKKALVKLTAENTIRLFDSE